MTTDDVTERQGALDAIFIRLRRALIQGKGARLSANEVHLLDTTVLGEIMGQYDEEARK